MGTMFVPTWPRPYANPMRSLKVKRNALTQQRHEEDNSLQDFYTGNCPVHKCNWEAAAEQGAWRHQLETISISYNGMGTAGYIRQYNNSNPATRPCNSWTNYGTERSVECSSYEHHNSNVNCSISQTEYFHHLKLFCHFPCFAPLKMHVVKF